MAPRRIATILTTIVGLTTEQPDDTVNGLFKKAEAELQELAKEKSWSDDVFEAARADLQGFFFRGNLMNRLKGRRRDEFFRLLREFCQKQNVPDNLPGLADPMYRSLR